MDASLYATFYAVEDWYWWSVGTRAIFREWLVAALETPAPHLLDVGCGCGALTHELTALGKVTGLDISPRAIDYTRRRGLRKLCVGRAETLPFKTAYFDAVTAVDVMEHTDDDRSTLREIARVLRPGGAALIHVPAFPVLWGEHDEVNHHRCRYRRTPLGALIEESGLHIERLSYINCLIFPPALAIRLGKRGLRRIAGATTLKPEIYDLPRWFNSALITLLGLERALLQRVNLPFGVSLLCLARKHRMSPDCC